jgi:dipeptidyl aminopeptidase/acylaminoacyl peptidase
MPSVESGEESYRWRSVWVYEMATGSVRQVSPAGCNAWEAVWCGNGDIAAVVSPGASEGQWYTARLHILALESGNSREIFVPRDQIGCPAANPSGTQLAVVEAICSDRWIVAGELRLIEPRSAKVRPVHTADVDITSAEWRDERHLLLTGHRGPESVIGLLDAVSNVFEEIWASEEITSGGRYFTVSGCNDTGDCVFAAESFKRAPEIAIVRGGKYAAIKSFDLGYAVHASDINSVESVSWWAPDGLEIQGWLLRPRGAAPYPMVMSVHGGPVWHARPRWLGRTGLDTLMLLKLGYAVFFPNVRGSAGRGQEFARHVLGDMGGADTHDFLSGLDFLVSARIADPRRLGVTGGSYGGFITSWLITQDARFAAAVPAAPITNWVTEHLISNAPAWPALFLGDRYTNPDGKYFQRSPIMHAHKVKTPTLTICGALDRTTPPAEAVQFHNALLENGVKSVLVTYPQGGHGVPGFPAAIDYAARIVTWFEEHMPPDGEERTTSTAP